MLRKRGITFVRFYFNKYNRYHSTSLNLDFAKDGKDKNILKNSVKEPDKEIIDEIREKILYNTLLESLRSNYGTRKNFFANCQKKCEDALIQKSRKKSKDPIPLSLRYFSQDPVILNEVEELDKQIDENIESNVKASFAKGQKHLIFPYAREEQVTVKDNWMSDYETYKEDDGIYLEQVNNEDVLTMKNKDENIDDAYQSQNWKNKYGSPDPNAKASDVPCGGCGATLHCKDTSIPGYLPSEIFKNCNQNDLQKIQCQRCHFLKEYNLALGLNVRPQDYEQMLRTIYPHKALIILMVDLLDFPCSIWPNILDLIGENKRLVVVGNKVDLIPQSSSQYLSHIESTLKQAVLDSTLNKSKIEHVALISAKTGWGIEDLVTKLNKIWLSKGDVYIVGTTNVGKSTLFNALLQSDYCKFQAADLLQRATVSPWPGTTLNLLKFPIARLPGSVLYLRHQRLMKNKHLHKEEERIRYHMIKKVGDPKYATLSSKVERTLPNLLNAVDSGDPFSYGMESGFKDGGPLMGINDKSRKYRRSRWCHDTPGVVHPEQIITLLTIEELMCVLPKELIRPRTFYLHKNQSIFIAGLARVDVLECRKPIRLNVFASNKLPLTVCNTDDADLIYSKLLGTDYFTVPIGNRERLSKWPELICHSKDIHVEGLSMTTSTCDIVLSSSGWVSLNAVEGETVQLAAWVIGGKGIHIRKPSLVDRACQMKGERIMGTPAYKLGNLFVDRKKLNFQKK